MQRTADDIIRELSVKRKMRQQLREVKRHQLNEQGFIEPFKDVFRALRLAAMDISNSLRLAIGMIFTFDSEKLKKKIEAFDTRRQKINQEWAPILQRADDAFKNFDPILSMAVMGPANFLAVSGIGPALTTGKTAAEILTATNWNELKGSFSTTLDLNQTLTQFFKKFESNEAQRQEREVSNISSARGGKGKGLLAALSNVFSEGTEEKDHVLLEQLDKSKKDDSKNEKKSAPDEMKFSEKEAIDLFIKITGMDKQFEETRKASLENLKGAIQGIKEEIEPMKTSAQLFAAEDPEGFKKAFESAKSQNPKMDDKPLDKFMKVMSDETEKLMKDPKFIEGLKKQSGGKELPPDQMKIQAQTQVFKTTKAEFDKQLAKGLKNAVDFGGQGIKNLKIDDKVLDFMKKSPYNDSKEVAKLYEELTEIYKGIKNDFETKAKSKAG